MKKLLLFQFCLVILNSSAQFATGVMDFNNTSAIFSNTGYLFNDFVNNIPGYEIGHGSGLNTLYSTNLILAGHDVNGQLKMAMSGDPNYGIDFRSGPFASTGNYSDSSYQSIWSGTYTICQQDIDDYIVWWECENFGSSANGDCSTATPPSSYVLQLIYNYPAHGNELNGESHFLAPFYDYDGNDTYNPDYGDYPLIKRGCCMSYLIFNDMAGVHTYSNSDPIGVEVHMILYQYNSFQEYLHNATFVDLKVINKSTQTLYDFATSLFVDPDLGNYGDDMIGCDSTLNLSYVYNGDDFDESNAGNLGFGQGPPAFGVVELTQGISSHVPNALANGPQELYNCMLGLKPDGSNYVDEFGMPTKFVYHDDPNVSNGYSQWEQGMVPGDQRFFTNTLTPVLTPGDTVQRSFAFIYAEGNDHLNSVSNLMTVASQTKQFYDNESTMACEGGVWNVNEIEQSRDFTIYPNPALGPFTIELSSFQEVIELSVVDMLGNEHYHQPVLGKSVTIHKELSAGVYLIVLTDGMKRFTKQLVIR